MSEDLLRNEKRSGPEEEVKLFNRKRKQWTASTQTWGAVVDEPDASYVTSVRDHWTVGWNTPRFNARRRKGELIPYTPFWQFLQEGATSATYLMNYADSTPPGNYKRYWSEPDGYVLFSGWVVSYSEVEAILPELDTSYVQAAAAKIYGEGHDTLTFLAELSSTYKLFSNLGRTILRAVKTKGRSVRGKMEIASSADDWLSARYGWRTLVYDIIELDKAIRKFDTMRTRYSKVVYSNTTTSCTQVSTTPELYLGATSYWNKEITDEVNLGIRGCVAADIQVPRFQLNPIQTGWELIPFSFVVDWFVNVGKAIAAASFLAHQSKYTASVGRFAEINRVMKVTHTDSIKVWGTYEQHATCSARIEVRTPCTVPLTPSFSSNLNPLKVLDLVALVVQRNKRR